MVSVIIVNYNVKYFLEQCLFSVRAALKQADGEVIVVDNASSDGSREYLEPRFPEVRFIWNRENLGFARANNLALEQSRGNHILFLNPDTIIGEDALASGVAFMEAHPEAGAIGVRMIDGSGNFLKESKRAYPSLWTSFSKLTGLAGLFPHSRVFASYHLGHLDPLQNHEVDVLAGAYMWVRREAIQQVGSFDERFFMYGEDIDLSYRLQAAGWKNYYVADTTVIHFKGESTKKGSLNYVRMFYKAMAIFVEKHYTSITAFFFRFFITVGIWLRAGVTAVSGLIRRMGFPIIDALSIFLAFLLAKFTWNGWVKPDVVYNRDLLEIAFPAFTIVFIAAAYYAGLYDRTQKPGRVIHSTLIATTVMLVVYSLLPEKYRFSRGILVMASIFAFILLTLTRAWARRWHIIEAEEEEKLGTVIVADQQGFDEATAIMEIAERTQRVLGRVALHDDGKPMLTTLALLPAYVKEVPIREIIFCQGALRFAEIIAFSNQMPPGVRLRVTSQGARSIVGSDSSASSGQIISNAAGFAIGTASAKRLKRLVDLLASAVFIISWPLQCILVRNPLGLLTNAVAVILCRKTWVGYSSNRSHQNGLPRIRNAVIGTNALPKGSHPETDDGLYKLDQLYAKEYTIYKDLYLLAKGYIWIGS